MAVNTDEMLAIHRPDHAERTLELLLRQHKGKPRIEALIRALAKGVQLLENTAWAVIAGGTLNAAEGRTLDRWGELAGEGRGGLTHEEYRRSIGLRARVNTLFPSEDMLWGLLAGASVPFGVVNRYLVSDGMVWQITVPELPSAPASEHIGALMRDARPLGFYSAVVLSRTDSFGWTSEFDGPDEFAELIYDGRSRA